MNPKLKWVNDVYLSDKKISGVLPKAVNRGDGMSFVWIGIGVNINCMPETNIEVTSLKQELNQFEDIPVLPFAHKLSENIINNFDAL